MPERILRARERRTGYTPLLFACYLDKRRESALIAGYLLERGAELDARERSGRTPLMVAVQSAGYDVIQMLLRFGPDLEVRDENGRDVFDLAQAREDPRVRELARLWWSSLKSQALE